jgi:hypothetical protein
VKEEFIEERLRLSPPKKYSNEVFSNELMNQPE